MHDGEVEDVLPVMARIRILRQIYKGISLFVAVEVSGDLSLGGSAFDACLVILPVRIVRIIHTHTFGVYSITTTYHDQTVPDGPDASRALAGNGKNSSSPPLRITSI